MYMKRILTILASVAMVMAAVSCEEQTDSATLSLDRPLYFLVPGTPMTLDVVASSAPTSDLTVGLAFTGTAVMDEDYTVSSTVAVIPAGELKGTVEITPSAEFDPAKEIVVTMTLPAGYTLGRTKTAVITYGSSEQVVYNFATGASDVVGPYKIEVSFEGVESEGSWRATKDMQIPYTITPLDGASASQIVADEQYFTIAAGDYKAYLTVRPGKDYDNSKFEVALDADQLFIEGENKTITLNVRGIVELSDLVGTWEFAEVLDLEEVELWYMEYEDDPDLLPTHNEGFKFTISENGGKYKFTPSGEGDWMKYFRESEISYCAPVNMCANGFATGDYTSSEVNMFVSESEGVLSCELTYFSLSSVNRSFDNESESLGTGAIAINYDADGNLLVHLKDYDEPPFGFMWWDGFEGEMFGFVSRFTKEQ